MSRRRRALEVTRVSRDRQADFIPDKVVVRITWVKEESV